VQRFWQALQPRGDARPEWEFLQELVEAVTGLAPAASLEGLFNRMTADIPALAGIRWGDLGETGIDLRT
jgi:predicted molibdopterin-dependent oxidoreductase YjgC